VDELVLIEIPGRFPFSYIMEAVVTAILGQGAGELIVVELENGGFLADLFGDAGEGVKNAVSADLVLLIIDLVNFLLEKNKFPNLALTLSEKIRVSGMHLMYVLNCVGSFLYASLAPVFITNEIPSMFGKLSQAL